MRTTLAIVKRNDFLITPKLEKLRESKSSELLPEKDAKFERIASSLVEGGMSLNMASKITTGHGKKSAYRQAHEETPSMTVSMTLEEYETVKKVLCL